MLSLEQCRKIDPRLELLPDEEVLKLLESLYGLGQLAFESYIKENAGSKNPEGLLLSSKGGIR